MPKPRDITIHPPMTRADPKVTHGIGWGVVVP
jgi:hypothetical protein